MEATILPHPGYGTRNRGTRTRKRILDAARRLFSAHGFASTTVRDIAVAADITDAAIYYHFPDKAAILHALIQSGSRVLPSRGAARRDPAQTMVEAIVDRATRVIESNADLLKIVLREALAGDNEALSRYADWLDTWESRLTALMARRTGSSDGLDKQRARQVLYLVLMAAEDMLLLRRDPNASPSERRLALRSFLGQGLIRLLGDGEFRSE